MLNRETSSLYLGVIPIFKRDNKLFLYPPGSIIDYAVWMKELPQRNLMNKRIENNDIDLADIVRVATKIATFHKKSQSSKNTDKYGSFETVKYNWDENFKQTEPYIGITIFRETFNSLRNFINKFMYEKKELFQKRISEGYIKYCHGDLHSGNIFITENGVELFDRIEFNLRFAYGDTSNEIAFLLMDLEFRDKFYLSSLFLDHYIHKTKDLDILLPLDFYKLYRAYVRGKVIGFQLKDHEDEKKFVANKYFKLANFYREKIEKGPILFVVHGLPATGKTTLSKIISNSTGAIHLRSDVLRRILSNHSLDKHHYHEIQNGLYTKTMSDKVYNLMAEKAYEYLIRNHSVIIDATFSSSDRWEKMQNKFKNFEIIKICTNAQDEIVKKNLSHKEKNDPVSDATLDVYKHLKKTFKMIKGSIVINTSDLDAGKKELLRILKEKSLEFYR